MSKLQIISWLALGALLASLLGGCGALPLRKEFDYPAQSVSMPRAIRIAAQAMQEGGFLPVAQNEAAGTLRGQKTILGGDAFGFSGTFFMDVTIRHAPTGALHLDVVCSPGPEVAFSTDLPAYIATFQEAFERLLQQPDTARQRPPEQLRPPPTRPVPERPAAPPKTKEYDL